MDPNRSDEHQAFAQAAPSSSAFIARLEGMAHVVDLPHAGRNVRWRVFGAGQPLVLLHGGHGSWLHWARNIVPLASSHRLLVPDLPGYGDSACLEATSDDVNGLQSIVDAVQATVLQLVEGQSFGVAGFSFGGMVAATLARECASVRRLCLLGPAAHGMPRRQTQPLLDWRKAPDAQSAASAFRQNLASFMLHELDAADTLAPSIHERSCRAARFRSKTISRRGGLVQVVSGLQCPVLAVWGEHDVTAHPADVAEALRAGRPDREWCLLPGAGHWVQYERPQIVNALLETWFRPS